jgi:drug/metabolite transporter (DMT)-like permease
MSSSRTQLCDLYTYFLCGAPRVFLKQCLIVSLAMIAFAANSVLCRLALVDGAIDAGSYTLVRIFSGAVTLLFLSVFLSSKKETGWHQGNWRSAVYLFIYAITISYGYLGIDTGLGALILFGAVQITMILVSYFRGQALNRLEWLGTLLAFGGFIYLMLPEDIDSVAYTYEAATLMIVSGVAWGFYTLAGKGVTNPLLATSGNFLRGTILGFPLLMLLVLALPTIISLHGILLACASGALASACGYAIWYVALRGLSSLQAGVVQLTAPLLTALGGLLFISEAITLQFVITAALILGGVFIVLFARSRGTNPK